MRVCWKKSLNAGMGGIGSFHVEKNQPDLMRKRNFDEIAIFY